MNLKLIISAEGKSLSRIILLLEEVGLVPQVVLEDMILLNKY